jgi:hypothetical protein
MACESAYPKMPTRRISLSGMRLTRKAAARELRIAKKIKAR